MITIDNFEKRYVVSVSFNDSDEILVTDGVTGQHITDCELIHPGMIIKLEQTESTLSTTASSITKKENTWH